MAPRPLVPIDDLPDQDEQDMLRRLHAGELSTAQIALLIDMADHGHRSADRVLRRYIASFIGAGRFDDLSVSVRAYNVRLLLRQARQLPWRSEFEEPAPARAQGNARP
jgi:hypothetical protein